MDADANANANVNANANANADAGGSTIALRERSSGELKTILSCLGNHEFVQIFWHLEIENHKIQNTCIYMYLCSLLFLSWDCKGKIIYRTS